MKLKVTDKEYKSKFIAEFEKLGFSLHSADLGYKEILQNKDVVKTGNPIEDVNRIIKNWRNEG